MYCSAACLSEGLVEVEVCERCGLLLGVPVGAVDAQPPLVGEA